MPSQWKKGRPAPETLLEPVRRLDGIFGPDTIAPGGRGARPEGGTPGLSFDPQNPLNWPHVSIAAAPGAVVQMLNNSWNVYPATGRTSFRRTGLFGPGGLSLQEWFSAPFGLDDVQWYGAQCQFDPEGKRFFQMALGLDFRTLSESYIMIAVSDREDPADTWTLFLGRLAGVAQDLRFGVDPRLLIATYTEYGADGTSLGVRLRAYRRPDLTDAAPGTAISSSLYLGFEDSVGAPAASLRPCLHHGENLAFYLLNVEEVADEFFDLGNVADVWRVLPSPTGRIDALAFERDAVRILKYSSPPYVPQPAKRKLSSSYIRTGSAWPLSAVADQNQIWGCLNSGVFWGGEGTQEAALQWFQIDARDPGRPRLVQQGRVGQKGYDYFAPALDTTSGARRGMAMVFTRCSASHKEYPSMRVITRNSQLSLGKMFPSRAVPQARGRGSLGPVEPTLFGSVLWGPYFGAARHPTLPDRVLLSGASTPRPTGAQRTGFEWGSWIVSVKP